MSKQIFACLKMYFIQNLNLLELHRFVYSGQDYYFRQMALLEATFKRIYGLDKIKLKK